MVTDGRHLASAANYFQFQVPERVSPERSFSIFPTNIISIAWTAISQGGSEAMIMYAENILQIISGGIVPQGTIDVTLTLFRQGLKPALKKFGGYCCGNVARKFASFACTFLIGSAAGPVGLLIAAIAPCVLSKVTSYVAGKLLSKVLGQEDKTSLWQLLGDIIAELVDDNIILPFLHSKLSAVALPLLRANS